LLFFSSWSSSTFGYVVNHVCLCTWHGLGGVEVESLFSVCGCILLSNTVMWCHVIGSVLYHNIIFFIVVHCGSM
jgi:hypothetical protein